jgi:hypothetical protein
MSGINHPVKNLNRDPRQANKRLSQQNLPEADERRASECEPCVHPTEKYWANQALTKLD